jgi:ribonuclease P protein component
LFGKNLRLLNASDFKAVFDDAPIRASHQHLLILSRSNISGTDQNSTSLTEIPRLGLVIAKKNVRLAVHRNRIKRIARETFRLQQDKLPGVDAVVLARRGLDSLDNAELQKLFNKQWSRIIKKAKQVSCDA